MAAHKREYRLKNGRNPREAALVILLRVCEEKEKSHYALRETLEECREMDQRDRALAKRIAEGTLDYLLRLDCLIGRYSKKPLSLLKPVIRNILRMSLYQILYMDKVPKSAVCNEAVELAKLHGLLGLTGFVNGVLRNMVRDLEKGAEKITRIQDEATDLAMPSWLMKKYIRDFGHDRAREIAESYLCQRSATLRLNCSKAFPEEICSLLREDGVSFEMMDMEGFFGELGLIPGEEDTALPVMLNVKGIMGLSGIRAFQEGLLQPQDPSSAIPAFLAAPKEGDYVIDVCAAPGGKSLQLADMLSGSGTVEARDLTEQKAEMIRENIQRSGFKNIRTRVMDALVPDEESYYRADILMADLPCSGLGIAARKPDIKLNVEPYSITELCHLQRDILKVVSRYVKPGGKLVYSTCTLTPEEDEENAAWAAEELGFILKKEVKVFPGADRDGFYAALLEKKKY